MIAAALALAALALPPQPPDSAPLIAAYRQAVAQMGPAPKYMTFHETILSDDVYLRMFRDDDGIVHTGVILGRANGGREAVQVQYRADDALAYLQLSDGSAGLSHSPFYDPTWAGMRAWLRYGLQGSPPNAPVITQKAEEDAARQALISVKAFTVAFYRLEDKGDQACPDGSPGRAIHMTAYKDVDAHPLSDVVIDASTLRFCSMRFHLYVPGQVSFSGFVELHFANVEAYYLATTGTVEGDVNDILASQTTHARIAFARTAFAFPPAMSAEAFTPKAAAPTTSSR